jgi:hypothetical protein
MTKYITAADLAPLTSDVKVRGGMVQVHPLDLPQLGALMHRHSAMQVAFSGEGDMLGSILSGGRALVYDIIAMATQQEGLGEKMTGIEQGNVIAGCLEMTIPQDVEEFADFLFQMRALAERARMATPLLQKA